MHREFLFLERADRLHRGFGGGEVGRVGNFLRDGGGADLDFVGAGLVAAWRVDDEVDLAVFHHVDDIRARLFGELEEAVGWNAFGAEAGVRAAGRVNREAKRGEVACDGDGAVLVAIGDREEDIAGAWQRVEGGDLRLCVGHAPIAVDAHHLAGRFHFRAEHDVDAGKAVPREDRFFY